MSEALALFAPGSLEAPEIYFTVPGTPAPQGSKRPIGFRGGRHLMIESNPATRPWRALVSDCAAVYRNERLQEGLTLPLDGPLGARFVFRFARPASIKPARRPHPHTKPDLSKLVRAVEDSLTGIIIRDDARIVCLSAVKQYGDPGVTIEIWRLLS